MLDKTTEKTKYKLGIIAPRNFDNGLFLSTVLSPNLKSIAMLITNNVISGGEIVRKYAEANNLPYTVYPILKQDGGTLISNSLIIQHSDFVYIFDDGASGNAKLALVECQKRNKKRKLIIFQSDIHD